MPIVTFDTSVFIAYKPAELPAGFRMSTVVIQELTAGAIDKSEVQYWNASRIAHEKAGTLLVPTGEDWWIAGKVINSLLRGLKSKAIGKKLQSSIRMKNQGSFEMCSLHEPPEAPAHYW